jgi:flagellar basal-body rod protein FlgF
MIRGIAASRAGLAWEQTRTEVIANNIANMETDGFKRSVAVGAEFGQMLLHRMGDRTPPGEQPPAVGMLGHGATVAEVAVDSRQGGIRPTGRPLDIALLGPGELTYQMPDGTLGYTRSGVLHQDVNGRLVTREGYPVLVGGQPVGTPGSRLEIRPDGEVLVDGRSAGRLDIRGGENTRIEVGALETSNVDLAQEMTDLIVALRSFQVNQRALQVQDQTVGKAIESLGNI